MTSVFEITNLAGVLSFAAWTLVVCALAKFLFGSYPAAEILYRLAQRDRVRQHKAAELAASTTRSPLGKRSDVERELEQLRVAPAWQRLLSYLLTCFSCQTFWAAVVVFALTRGTTDWRAWLFSAAAYSAAATLLVRASQGRAVVAQRSGCGACGGRKSVDGAPEHV